MKFHYVGKFSGNPEDLPDKGHEEGAVKFKEPGTPKKLAIVANGIAVALYVLVFAIYLWRSGGIFTENKSLSFSLLGMILSFVTLYPHELLHAICFKEDVYMYTNWKQGMLFVTGPERMSKGQFVFLSLLPNLVFGFLPFIIFLIFAKSGNVSYILKVLGTLGAFAIPMGAGDYLNVFNALTQMPKGAKTYMYKFNSFWYMPK